MSRTRNAFTFLTVAVFVGMTQTASVSAATRFEVIVDEPLPNRSVAWPMTTGVPFPRGGLADPKNCRLIDDTGAEHPLQAKVTATWDAQRRSIRWLTIDFLAQPGRRYFLEFGNDVLRKVGASSLKATPGEPLRVSTGTLAAEFSMKAKSALGTIRVDLNGDGRIDADESVASGSAVGDHYYIDQKGRSFSSAGDGADRVIVVEASGPVRACIRVDGYYTGPKGERIVKYRTRYHFFAGLGLIKLVDEFSIVGSTKQTQFKDIGFALDLNLNTSRRTVTADSSAATGSQPVSMDWQATTESVSSYQTTYRHYGNPEYEAAVVEVSPTGEKRLTQTDRAGSWLQVADERAVVTGSLRWFWQQFPKEWEVTPTQLRLHLWSPRAGLFDFGADGLKRYFGPAGDKYLLNWRGTPKVTSPISNFFYHAGRDALANGDVDGLGINKHHEVFLHFAPAKKRDASAEYGQLASPQPLALASGEWNCSTDVFGPLMHRPNDSKYEAIVDRLFDLKRMAQDAFGDYGWWLFGSGPHYSYQWDPDTKRHYADPRRFEYHTYQKETQLWWCYLRSGERKFHDWAIPSENHWTDIAVSHVPTKFHSYWLGGDRNEQTLTWAKGDWGVDSALHYVRQHDNAEAWLRGGAQFWASYHRTLETTTLAYFITGDERYNDVINFWREYWGDLAGKTSASTDIKPWHRQQAWFQPTKPGEPVKTWAEMIRDYAPFTSGSRHQQTLFFNLATLYEHTWDPQIKLALQEYADAFLDADGPIGAWMSQENHRPRFADAPKLAHFWTPALWKYARASGDPRMKEVFQKYFDACYTADPFREDVGNYSNVQIGYAYYFTRDPKHLRPAVLELERLWPLAEPLARQQDLGMRIYNPYAPIRSFTAVPRLTWALNEAKKNGVSIPPPAVMHLQRTAIAIDKQPDTPLHMKLWGHDDHVTLISPNGDIDKLAQVKTQEAASDIQPFDRNLRDFEVYLHDVVIPANAPAGVYVLTPKLELAILELDNARSFTCNAARPIAVEAGGQWSIRIPKNVESIQLQTAVPASLKVMRLDGTPAARQVAGNTITIALSPDDASRRFRVYNPGRTRVWFQLTGWPAEQCWVTSSLDNSQSLPIPSRKQTLAALPPALSFDPNQLYVKGRFGKALQIIPGRKLHIPDHFESDGKTTRLFSMQQGTIEFWIKRLWDDRITKTSRVTYVSNGLLQAAPPWKLPVNEWAHVAIVWRPFNRDPSQTLLHYYVDGLDQAIYRSTWWKGYSSGSFRLSGKGKWLEEFLSQAPSGTAFAIDELRVSGTPRYTDPHVIFGGQQTFNPFRFDATDKPFQSDTNTHLLFHFDGDLKDSAKWSKKPIIGRTLENPRK